MVDCSLDSISTIKFNATHTKLIDKSTILKADVFATIKKLHLKQTKFDIIFCDPPYHQDLCLKVLQMLHEYPLLTEDGIIIMEHAIEDNLPSDFHQYTLLRNQKYGSTTQISIYELKSNKSED